MSKTHIDGIDGTAARPGANGKADKIHGDALGARVSLTMRQLRQIAKDGFIPRPVDGFFPKDETMDKLVAYYRGLSKRHGNKKEEIDEEKHRKLKLENDETSGRLTDTDKLSEQVAASLVAFRDMIYAKIESEAPTAMSTLDVPSARIIGRRLADELVLKIQAAFKAWSI